MDDPHQILGLSPSATQEEVKKAYRQLAQKYHPDTGSQADAKQFAEIVEAYQFLRAGKLYVDERMQPKEEPLAPQPHLYTQRIDLRRKKEQEAFYQSKFRHAVLKTIGLSLLTGALFFLWGGFFHFYPWVGGVIGLLYGAMFGMRRFFDLRTFLSPKKFLWHHWSFGISAILVPVYILISIGGVLL